jgi:hypothetical protein
VVHFLPLKTLCNEVALLQCRVNNKH